MVHDAESTGSCLKAPWPLLSSLGDHAISRTVLNLTSGLLLRESQNYPRTPNDSSNFYCCTNFRLENIPALGGLNFHESAWTSQTSSRRGSPVSPTNPIHLLWPQLVQQSDRQIGFKIFSLLVRIELKSLYPDVHSVTDFCKC